MKDYYVYIMANRSRRTYTGMTNNLESRVSQHKHMAVDCFTRRYLIDRLVYFEVTQDVLAAITREKEIKAWRRSKKVALIESVNPDWRNLSSDWADIKPPRFLVAPRRHRPQPIAPRNDSDESTRAPQNDDGGRP